MDKFEILKMKDKSDKLHIDKKLLFNLPAKIAIVGRSQLSGKTNMVSNFLLRDIFYKNEFAPENIFIISPSLKTDKKLATIIEERDIPEENLFTEYQEEVLEALYEMLKDEYNEKISEGEQPQHKLFLFDDMSASGKLKEKMNGIMSKIFCNGRHILLSVIVTSQKYSDILTSCRENLTGGIFFAGTNKQLELIYDDHSHYDKKTFINLIRKTTKEPHSFFVVNYSNPHETRYMNSLFKPIGSCGEVLKSHGGNCPCG